MQVRKIFVLSALAFACVGILGTMLLLPGNVLAAWSNCDLNDGSITMLVGDIAAQPDGTLYAVIADPDNNISVRKWSWDSCTTSKIKLNSNAAATTDGTDTPSGGGASPEAAIEGFDPKIAVTSDGEVVITYRDQGTAPYTIYYQRKPAGSSSFENPVPVTTNGYVGGVAIDNAKNVHVVWYRSGGDTGGFYQKFNANDKPVGDTKQLTTFGDAEPEVATDAANDAHVTYMVGPSDHNDVKYRRIEANGTMDGEVDIAKTSGHSIYPDIAVAPDGSIHIAWQGRDDNSKPYQPYYRECDSGGSNCGSQKRVATTETNSLAVDVTACGSGPYVSWYNEDNNGKQVYMSKNLAAPDQIDPGTYNATDNAAGKVYMLYRNGNGKAAYARQADSTCTGSDPGAPTSTPTMTLTPSQTPVPTDGPSPTPTDTPTATPTSGAKGLVDDKDSPPLVYSGTWDKRDSLACLNGGTYRRAEGKRSNTVALNFHGSRIRYWYVQDSTMGTVRVKIDGAVVGRANLGGSGGAACKQWTSDPVPAGNHTLELVPKRGTGRISLDAIKIIP